MKPDTTSHDQETVPSTVGLPTSSDSAPKTPRWVKVFGVIAVVAVLLLAIGLLTGGHGPGRHTPQSNAIEQHVSQP